MRVAVRYRCTVTFGKCVVTFSVDRLSSQRTYVVRDGSHDNARIGSDGKIPQLLQSDTVLVSATFREQINTDLDQSAPPTFLPLFVLELYHRASLLYSQGVYTIRTTIEAFWAFCVLNDRGVGGV